MLAAAWLALSSTALAGGDPREVLVVTNAEDDDAQAIAEHYAVSRELPHGRICALSGLDPTTTELSFADYDSLVVPAIDACLAALPDPDAIHLLVTTRGLPYRVDLGAGYDVGFEALLQVHHTVARSDGSPLAGAPQTDLGGYFAASVGNPAFIGGRASTTGCDFDESNDYAAWYTAACRLLNGDDLPLPFDRHGSWDGGTWLMAHNLFIVTRLDGFDADDAMDLVDRGVAADGTFPTAPLLCMHGADSARGARDPECELVVRRLSEAGLNADWIDTFDGGLSGWTIAGYLTGAASMTGAIADNTYVPGAITDNLTSYGAVPTNFFCDETGEVCPASESQTSVARFIRAGATGAHGTVAEPLNNVAPNASLYLLYTFGYSLGESYFFSQRYLYWQNLVLGDPLTTPYATRPTLSWSHHTAPEDGTLTLTAHHPHGIARVRVFQADLLVAEAEGAELTLHAEELGASGDVVELYAVAEAAPTTVSRPGWEADTHTVTAGTRGWTWSTLTLTDAEGAPDTGDPTDTGEPIEAPDTGTPSDPTVEPDGDGGDKSSGCTTVGASSVGLVWLAALIGVGHRREPFHVERHPGERTSCA